MDTNQIRGLVRKAFSKGLSGEEALQLELEAVVNAEAKAILEQAERDDERIHVLGEELKDEEPWYGSKLAAVAATAIVTVGATFLTTNTLVRVGLSSGLASSTVVYLEAVRGVGTAELPTVSLDGKDEWITLVAYPAYDNFTEFRIRVERLEGDEAHDMTSATWTPIWERRSGTGNQDSLAVNVRSDLLDAGVYRLHVEGRVASSNNYASAADLLFRVDD